MGHRALVAYERPDGTYNLHYSHWGACHLRLTNEITADTPFAGEHDGQDAPRAVYEQLQTASSASSDDWEQSELLPADVEYEPRSVGVTFDELLEEHLNYLSHEALYDVSTSFEVTAYRTFWLGFSHEVVDLDRSPTTGNGLIATVRWYEGEPVGDGYCRGWFDGTKSILADAVGRGTFTEVQATQLLVDRFRVELPNRKRVGFSVDSRSGLG
jgi:hypothetical protein